jgi:hypothetical protein
MYRGFYLSDLPEMTDTHYTLGLQLFEDQRTIVEKSLKAFIYKENILDASKLQSSWFPTINADIFLSHSHQDASNAIRLAGWLYKKFKLKTFIDSQVWKYAHELLKIIDDEYCRDDNNSNYDYNKRNISTSHVHMMLSSALSVMIDKTECLFFLETPSSISPSDNIKENDVKRVRSPWIYHELIITQLIEKKLPERHIVESDKQFSKAEKFKKSIEAVYSVDLSHLESINSLRLLLWDIKVQFNEPANPLDILYEMISAPKHSILNS